MMLTTMQELEQATTVARRIARHLDGWTFAAPVDDDPRGYERFPRLLAPGRAVALSSRDVPAGRLRATGYATGPERQHQTWPLPAITFDASRPPAALAADIRSRLLGRLEEYVGGVRMAARRYAADATAREAATARLEALGWERCSYGTSEERQGVRLPGVLPIYATVTAADGAPRIHLDPPLPAMTPDQVDRAARAMRGEG